MKPIAYFPDQARHNIRYLLSDIDDTITHQGRLPSQSLMALERLSAAGLKVILVTGRPAGWCDHFARMWPIDAIVGENGALWFSYDRQTKKMHSDFCKPQAEIEADRLRLNQIQQQILMQVPGCQISTDQFCRITDLAIDFCEDVEPLPQQDVQKIVSIFEAAGATAKISSIHVNGWFGDFDKLTTTKTCMQKLFDADIDQQNANCLFTGDSPNDQPMFAHFTHSVGVANVQDFDLECPPKWVTSAKNSAGFIELVDNLLA